ncbi:hypothetical protein BDY21DRAFT_140692 [Lineolata rhizophorae]|uniref:Uncharacterized protein n=1 Tax=Lineolata rhizophorae TaxID=578093 RepID=A0A6A6PBM1_9PEZI|nr:hypothetical protein BDY21DRAFT_140692 [Lineolata rhizophorae]
MEVDRRRLQLASSCSSLRAFGAGEGSRQRAGAPARAPGDGNKSPERGEMRDEARRESLARVMDERRWQPEVAAERRRGVRSAAVEVVCVGARCRAEADGRVLRARQRSEGFSVAWARKGSRQQVAASGAAGGGVEKRLARLMMRGAQLHQSAHTQTAWGVQVPAGRVNHKAGAAHGRGRAWLLGSPLDACG